MTSTLHYLCHPPSLTLSSVLYAATPVAAPRPSSPRSLNRAALEEVLQHESAARPVCGSRSEAKPSSLPSHILYLTKVHKTATNAVQSSSPPCTVVTCDDRCDKRSYSVVVQKITHLLPRSPRPYNDTPCQPTNSTFSHISQDSRVSRLSHISQMIHASHLSPPSQEIHTEVTLTGAHSSSRLAP